MPGGRSSETLVKKLLKEKYAEIPNDFAIKYEMSNI